MLDKIRKIIGSGWLKSGLGWMNFKENDENTSCAYKTMRPCHMKLRKGGRQSGLEPYNCFNPSNAIKLHKCFGTLYYTFFGTFKCPSSKCIEIETFQMFR
jgi:hypothetical protein